MRGKSFLLVAWSLAAVPAHAQIAPPTVLDTSPAPMRPIMFTKLSDTIGLGSSIGRAKWGWLCNVPEALPFDPAVYATWPQSYISAFNDSLGKVGFNIADSGQNLFPTGTGANVEFEVGAVIKSVSANICLPQAGFHDLMPIKGDLVMEVEWQIFDKVENKLALRLATRGTVSEKKTLNVGFPTFFLGAFLNNLQSLALSPELKALTSGPSRSKSTNTPGSVTSVQAPSKGPTITVKIPKLVVSRLADAIGATVLVKTDLGHGSGFLISSDGYFMTNYHVVGDQKYVKLRWSDGAEGQAEVIRSDKGRDVALLKGDSRGRAPLKLRATRAPVGTPIFAIGSPLFEQLQNSVTRGIISATRVDDGFTFLQTDASIQHGNSGGPVIDENSQLVALVVAGLEKDGLARGINFLIPAAEAYDFLGLKATP